MKFLSAGHWGYVEFAQIQAETGQAHEGKSSENYHTYTNHVWFRKSLGCKLLEIGEYSKEVLLHDCPRLIFLPWHLLFVALKHLIPGDPDSLCSL